MALPWDEIITPNKVRQLQRTLYRKAKENGRWRRGACRRPLPPGGAGNSPRGGGGQRGFSGRGWCEPTEQVKAGSRGLPRRLGIRVAQQELPAQSGAQGLDPQSRRQAKGRWASRP